MQAERNEVCVRRFGSGRLRDGLRAPAVFPSVPSATVAYANWAELPTTDGSIQYDNNGNNDGTGQTISAGNRVTFDGTYYYQFDAAGNRTFKYKSDTGAGLLGHGHHQVHLGPSRPYDGPGGLCGLFAIYLECPNLAIKYTYDAFNRQVDESSGSFDQRTIWDGTSALEMLNGSDGVTQRFLNGPAVDQVLAAEQVGGSYAGTNWLLADVQGTVRDVVRATVSDGSVTSVAAIDDVFDDVFGQQDAP